MTVFSILGKARLLVLFVVATHVPYPGATIPASDGQANHGCTDGLRTANEHGHSAFIFQAVPSGFASPRSRMSIERLQLAMDNARISLLVVDAMLPKPKAKDCGEIYRNTKDPMESGVYTIYPRSSNDSGHGGPLRVFCRVEGGQAWTTIQRRQDGSVDFYIRTWEDYSRGFGDLRGEFWLGNDNIHVLTNQGRYKLQVYFKKFARLNLPYFSGPEGYANYDSFRVESKEAKFTLRLGSYTGSSLDFLSDQNGFDFRLRRCNRPGTYRSCYLHKGGGFWKRRCDSINPNGYYFRNIRECPRELKWRYPGVSGLKFIEMRIAESD